MMRRATWFAGGVVAGVASASYAKRKISSAVRQTAEQLSPQHLTRSALDTVKHRSRHVADAIREGRHVARHTEDELRARREGRLTSLDEHVGPDDKVFVDGVPVDSGRVIVMRDRDPRR